MRSRRAYEDAFARLLLKRTRGKKTSRKERENHSPPPRRPKCVLARSVAHTAQPSRPAVSKKRIPALPGICYQESRPAPVLSRSCVVRGGACWRISQGRPDHPLRGGDCQVTHQAHFQSNTADFLTTISENRFVNTLLTFCELRVILL